MSAFGVFRNALLVRGIVKLSSHNRYQRSATHALNSLENCRTMSTGFCGSKLDLKFHDDGMAWVTMKSGQSTLHPEMIHEWHTAMDEVLKNPDCKGLISTGNDKFYCNGLDLKYIKGFADKQRQLQEYLDELSKMLVRLLLFPVPTVAAINGHAFAGGALLALAHDLRVMRSDRGWFCFNEIFVPIVFPRILYAILREKMSPGPLLTQSTLLGKRYTGPEALRWSLVDEVAEMSQLETSAKNLVEQFLKNGTIARVNLHDFKTILYSSVLEEPYPLME